MRRFGLMLLCALGLVAALGETASAQGKFPNRSIRIIGPFAPGGATDVIARMLAEQLRGILGEAVVVENKPGASGIVAIEEMARAKPDGHTLLIGNISTNGLTPLLLGNRMSINYTRDVQIVSRVGEIPIFFLASTAFAPKTFPEFVDYAKKNPGKVRYGSTGIGAIQQFDTEILARKAGIELAHIPNKGGGSAVLKDLMSGDIHVSWFNIATPAGLIRAGQVRAMALAGDKRLPEWPDVPTLAELGYPNIGSAQWQAIFAPAETPPAIVEMLHQAIAKALNAPAVREAYRTGGILPPPAESVASEREWYRKELQNWAEAIRTLNIKVEE
jgi:tripartite-type tricarboxylate transporter receptor subunit TctC